MQLGYHVSVALLHAGVFHQDTGVDFEFFHFLGAVITALFNRFDVRFVLLPQLATILVL